MCVYIIWYIKFLSYIYKYKNTLTGSIIRFDRLNRSDLDPLPLPDRWPDRVSKQWLVVLKGTWRVHKWNPTTAREGQLCVTHLVCWPPIGFKDCNLQSQALFSCTLTVLCCVRLFMRQLHINILNTVTFKILCINSRINLYFV